MLALLALACGLTPSLRADVVFSTLTGFLSNGPGIIGSDFSAQGPQELASSFTPGADYSLAGAEVFLGGGGSVNVSVYSNTASVNGDIPGISLDSLGSIADGTGMYDGTPGLYTTDALSNSLILHNGVEYWLVLTPGSSSTYVSWGFGTNPSVLSDDNFQGNGWNPYGYSGALFQINGDPEGLTVTPEPATLWFAFPSLAAIMLARKRYCRQ